MIKAEFYKNGRGQFKAYVCSGHSFLAESGSDIVCAAFSTMTNLLIGFVDKATKNAATEPELEVDNEKNLVRLSLKPLTDLREQEFLDRAFELICREMQAIAHEYPENAKVIIHKEKL